MMFGTIFKWFTRIFSLNLQFIFFMIIMEESIVLIKGGSASINQGSQEGVKIRFWIDVEGICAGREKYNVVDLGKDAFGR